MITDIAIYKSAKVLIEQLGDNTAIHAAQRADQMLDHGDLGGRNVWVRIIEAIQDLRNAEPHGKAN